MDPSVIVVACLFFGWPLCWGGVMLYLGCKEVSTIRVLNEYGQRATGKTSHVTMRSTRLTGLHGVVQFDYSFSDTTGQEHTFTGTQTIDADLAMKLLSHPSKDVIVLFLPQKSDITRLAQVTNKGMRGRIDYKSITGYLTAGIGVPLVYIGMVAATAVYLLFLRETANLFVLTGVFLLTVILCGGLLPPLIVHAIKRKFLADNLTLEQGTEHEWE